jgi:hypothetical protein
MFHEDTARTQKAVDLHSPHATVCPYVKSSSFRSSGGIHSCVIDYLKMMLPGLCFCQDLPAVGTAETATRMSTAFGPDYEKMSPVSSRYTDLIRELNY